MKQYVVITNDLEIGHIDYEVFNTIEKAKENLNDRNRFGLSGQFSKMCEFPTKKESNKFIRKIEAKNKAVEKAMDMII
jgi:predicted nucleotidyltransferase